MFWIRLGHGLGYGAAVYAALTALGATPRANEVK
jgi:hypothetical protein